MHGKESPGSRTGETEPEVRPQKVTSFAGRTGVQAGSQGVCVCVCVVVVVVVGCVCASPLRTELPYFCLCSKYQG